ncbi:hypothetical protein BWI17_16600 [Betaproteobacteria bacterium GR16-43]|nr:hypothetical protein BWI17_16600 [Betaproteobacteria bacterium GR16-43]
MVVALPAAAADPPDAARGEKVFLRYCELCHGRLADGTGRAAPLHDPRPANLRVSKVSEDYKRRIILGGGKSVGRSQAMPSWRAELSEGQVDDVLAYLRSIRIDP